MSTLSNALAAHPVRKKPYNAIRFVRYDGNCTPLYRVTNVDGERGAVEAMRAAMKAYGANCFYCGEWIPVEEASSCTLDHVDPVKNGGPDRLHNLLFACVHCNRRKGHRPLAIFDPGKNAEYLAAMTAHLTRCLNEDATKKAAPKGRL